MEKPEQAFTKDLLKRVDQAQQASAYPFAKFRKTVEERGGVLAAKWYLQRYGMSEGFETLKTCGRLDLTMEATIAEQRYMELFSDDEVNLCYALLCEGGYFK